MKNSLFKHVRIKYTAEQACWTWYTNEITETATPRHAFEYSLRMADTGWQSENHLSQTLEPLRNPQKLNFMEIPMGESIWATRSLLYKWHIHMFRAWSLAKHSAPPESLAGLLAPAAATRARRARQLKVEHRIFLLLERRVHQLDDAARLRGHIIFLDSDAVRVIFEFYARDNYAPTSKSGQHSLMGHLWTLADNKIVEDIHQPLRLDARANMNKRMSFSSIQNIINRSNVLKQRGIPRHCQLDKRAWVSNFQGTKVDRRVKKHKAHKHKLKQKWSRLLKPRKTWNTINEGNAAASSCWLGLAEQLHGWAWRAPSHEY